MHGAHELFSSPPALSAGEVIRSSSKREWSTSAGRSRIRARSARAASVDGVARIRSSSAKSNSEKRDHAGPEASMASTTKDSLSALNATAPATIAAMSITTAIQDHICVRLSWSADLLRR